MLNFYRLTFGILAGHIPSASIQPGDNRIDKKTGILIVMNKHDFKIAMLIKQTNFYL